MQKPLWVALIACLQLGACSTVERIDSTSSQAAQPPAPEKPDASEAPVRYRPFPADSFHQLLVAEFALRRNQYELALGHYMAQAHDTRDPGVVARATRLAQFVKADKASLDAALLWTEIEPDNPEAQFSAAILLTRAQRPLQALPHMERVLQLGGKTNFPAIAASSLNQASEPRLQLEQAFDALLLQQPQNTQLLIAKALLLQQRGEPESALQTIRRVQGDDEDNLHAIIIETKLLQQLGQTEQALAKLAQAVEQSPDNRRLRLQYARLLMNDSVEQAKQQFEQLLALSPQDPDLLMSLALISRESGDLAQSENYLNQLLDHMERRDDALLMLGQVAEQSGELGRAIDYYQQVSPEGNLLLASDRVTALYLQQQRLDEALGYLQALRQRYPEHAIRLYLREADILLKHSLLNEGYELLSEALQLYPQQSNLLYARSLISEKRQDLPRMEADLRSIIAQHPDNEVALNALGYTLTNHSDRYAEAEALIERALALKPGDPAIIDSLGWVAFHRGDHDKALRLLEQAYSALADHEIAAHLGEVLWSMNQRERAREIWRQGLQQNPDSIPIRSTIERLEVDIAIDPDLQPPPQPPSVPATPAD